MRIAHLALPALLTCFAPTLGRAQKAFIAATSETVIPKLEMSQGSRIGHELWIANNSTVPITIIGVRLSNCKNIRQFCGAHKLNVKIPASSRRRVFRIERDVDVQASDFRYSYSWNADSNSTAALTALAQGGSEAASARLDAIRHAEEIRRREVGYRDIELYASDVAELGERIVSLRAEPDSIVVPMDSVLFISQLRVLAIDSLGQSLGRYRAGFRFRMDPGAMRFAPPDTIASVEPGRALLILSPVPAVNQGRATPLLPVQFTLIVTPRAAP